jgi:hypothetical protein
MTERTLVFNEESRVDDPEALRFLVRSIFPAEPPAQIEQLVASLAEHSNLLQSPACVAETLRASLSHLLADSRSERVANLRMLGAIAQHEVTTAENRAAYVPGIKFNPDAVWYPNPTRFPHPTSVHDALPYAKLAKLVDRSTPVTSAGSCFATEISHHLQANGFNYVITEPHYHGGSPYSMASAAWGTIFNVPAMRQLVEKAFELRSLPRLLWRMEEKGATIFRDPFREEVEFASVAEYEANYPVHVEACRRALLEAEVFVITLGLTEIWQLKSDGSVLSRVPWRLSSSLVERRSLSVEENLAELETMLATLRRFNPRVQFIVTVSPVPLQATYRGDEAHVVVASSLSKCTLRVAAEQFAKRNSGVTYFPAFETVMYCTEQPFERDHRHVRRSTVARVMRLFHTMFVRDAGFSACQLASDLRERDGEVRFLLHPDWRGDFAPAKASIQTYLRSFTAEDRVQLVLWLPEDSYFSATEAEAIVVDIMRELALAPEQGPAMTILTTGTTAEPDAVLKLAGITLRSGGSDERATCRRSRELGLLCADARRGELREFFDRAREQFLVEEAVERAKTELGLNAPGLVQAERVLHGWRHQLLTGTTPKEAYAAMRQLHVATAGKFTAALEAPLRNAHPPRSIDAACASVLDAIDERRLAKITADLDRDGYHVFPERLSAEQCDRLLAFARVNPVVGYSGDDVLPFDDFEQGRGKSATFDFQEKTSLRSRDVQSLCVDPGFLRVAQAYLRCEPVLDLIALWWSLPFDRAGSAVSGQLFHFDLDRPQFLKFFVYLNDVGDENGPHHFVRGSHKDPRRGALADRRLKDEEVAKAYELAKDEVIFRAPRGTIFAEDTRGLHKGAAVRSGERLVFQLEFASTLFGAPFEVHDIDEKFSEGFREAVRARPRVMSRFSALTIR